MSNARCWRRVSDSECRLRCCSVCSHAFRSHTWSSGPLFQVMPSTLLVGKDTGMEGAWIVSKIIANIKYFIICPIFSAQQYVLALVSVVASCSANGRGAQPSHAEYSVQHPLWWQERGRAREKEAWACVFVKVYPCTWENLFWRISILKPLKPIASIFIFPTVTSSQRHAINCLLAHQLPTPHFTTNDFWTGLLDF